MRGVLRQLGALDVLCVSLISPVLSKHRAAEKIIDEISAELAERVELLSSH